MRLLLFLGAVAAVLWCADPKPAPPKTAARHIRIPVQAVAIEDVKASDFKATLENGMEASVVRVQKNTDDMVLAVVLDLVSDLSVIDPAREALAESFRQLPPSTLVALLRAQDGLQVVQDPTADRELLTRKLAEMPVSGKAALLDTVQSAAQLADAIAAKAAVRVAIVYITDSDVRNYREDFTNPVINSSDSRDLSRRFPEGLIREKISKTTETLALFQTPVFIAHLRYTSERLNEAYQSGLMQVASFTGGDAVFCRSTGEIPDAVTDIVARAQNQYRVTVRLPAKTPKTIQMSLSLRGEPLAHRTRWVLKP